MSSERQALELKDAVAALLDECRMVLPGVQALFGFQLVAVFNQRFADDLTPGEQRLHLLALGLVATAAAFLMAPAAYHRLREPRWASDRFVRLSSRLLLAGMVPLMAGLCLDFYLIGRLVFDAALPAALAAGFLLGLMALLWFALPVAGGREP